MPGHADAEYEQVAEPERQPGDKTDLCDVDGVQPIVRIDPKPDRAAGKHRRADVVADGVAREGCERRDAIGDVILADRPHREEIIKSQGAERPDDAKRGQGDLGGRLFRQRDQDNTGVDAFKGVDKSCDRESDDDEARNDTKPFPADPFLEAALQRGQQPLHSSSR